MRRTVLIVEDDSAIRQGLAAALRAGGYDTLEAADGHAGRERALRGRYDLLLLDLMLPGVDGLAILREVRRARPTAAVIIVTARAAEDERVEGLSVGADDYIAKPFGARELLARVAAVLRRSPERPLDVAEIPFPGGVIDLARRELRRTGKKPSATPLTEREAAILRYLAMHPGRAVSRDEMLSRVWGLDTRGLETRTVDMHVTRLREKLRAAGAGGLLRTARGQGYVYAGSPP